MTTTARKPENEILLRCVRTIPTSEDIDRLKTLLRQNPDWKYLVETAIRHKVIPLLHRSLKNNAAGLVPTGVMTQIGNHAQTIVRRNLFLTGELLVLLKIFENNDIPALPLRGPALTAYAYGDLGLRHFKDLDLLVRKQDVIRVKNILTANGYKPNLDLNGIRERTYLHSRYEYGFKHPGKGVMLEIQWRLMPRYFLIPDGLEKLRNNLTSVTVANRKIDIPLPEEQVLLLCMHGAKHCWSQLSLVCDLDALVRNSAPVPWETVIRKAEKSGVKRILLSGLLLSHKLLETPLPSQAWQEIKNDRGITNLAGEIASRLFKKGERGLRQYLFYFRARERTTDRIRYCLNLAITPTDRDCVQLPLPHTLFFFYSLILPFRLMTKQKL